MRLIDADDLLAKVQENAPGFMDSGSTITKAFIMAMINTKSVAPTIDAIPVVRCKDCRFLIDHYGFMDDGYCRNMRDEHNIKFKPDKDWFCADGERR